MPKLLKPIVVAAAIAFAGTCARFKGSKSANSPDRSMTPADLGRYLDYCSEMLSLTGKVAALYVRDFQDGVVLGAVNEVEDLTSGLCRKIWQKLMVLHHVRP